MACTFLPQLICILWKVARSRRRIFSVLKKRPTIYGVWEYRIKYKMPWLVSNSICKSQSAEMFIDWSSYKWVKYCNIGSGYHWLHCRTMQTAVGVFGGEAYVDGTDAPPLMVANTGKSSHPAISSLNCSPFIAVELCREHLVCDSICLFSCRSLFVSLVCGSDKMHNPMHRTHVSVVIKLWNLSHEEFCETSHIGRSTTDIVEKTVFDNQAFELGTSGCSCLKDVLAKIIQFSNSSSYWK